MGNRALPSTSVWEVVLAMEKAFPVLLSPSVDAVRMMGESQHLMTEALAILWVQKVGYRAFTPLGKEQKAHLDIVLSNAAQSLQLLHAT